MQQRGMPGLARTVPALARELDRAGQHPACCSRGPCGRSSNSTRRSPRPAFFKLASSGDADLCEVIEPALRAVETTPPRGEEWLRRIAQPTASSRALGSGDPRTRDHRRSEGGPATCASWFSPTKPSRRVRVEAARALGALRATGGEADADELARDKSPRGTVARIAGRLGSPSAQGRRSGAPASGVRARHRTGGHGSRGRPARRDRPGSGRTGASAGARQPRRQRSRARGGGAVPPAFGENTSNCSATGFSDAHPDVRARARSAARGTGGEARPPRAGRSRRANARWPGPTGAAANRARFCSANSTTSPRPTRCSRG